MPRIKNSYAVMVSLLIVVISMGQTYAQSFERNTIDSNFKGWFTKAFDFDKDGDMDIISGYNQVAWWENKGGNFTKHSIDSGLSELWSLFPVDLDGDGDNDLLTAEISSGTLAWYRNSGGGFKRIVIDDNFVKIESVAAADFDGDGDVDVTALSVATGSGPGKVAWFENDGRENFTRHSLDDSFSRGHKIAVADMNKDGRIDIVGCAASSEGVTQWRNLGNGNFSQSKLSGKSGLGIAIVDIDKNGSLEVVLCSHARGEVLITPGQTIASGLAWPSYPAPGDINNDGRIDVVVVNRDSDDIVWLENRGGNNFTIRPVDDGVEGGFTVDVGDFDGDGRLDIVAGSKNNKGLWWWRNTSSPASKSITVLSPNGGESLSVGSSHEIRWNSSGNINQVEIEFSADDGSSWSTITKSTSNDGRYTWEVPDEPSDLCLIRVSDANGGASDKSNDNFSIVDTQETITVTDPNGNETINANSSYKIRWNSSGNVDQVKIEFSSDDGSSWSTIVSGTSNDGSYNWDVPDNTSDLCLIRISDASDGDPSDESNDNFSIVSTQESITVTDPNGKETISANSSYKIRWNSSGNVDQVKIEFSSDDGSSWSTIVNNASNDGSYDWDVPDASSDLCLVRISDASDGDPVDESDDNFTIEEMALPVPEIASFSPVSGPPGTEVTISGNHFMEVSAVAFNGANANFEIDSETQIRAVVPYDATTGKISITNSSGVGIGSSVFTVLSDGDSIFGFNPIGDARVNLTQLGQNYGSSTNLKVEAEKFNTYLKFEITGVKDKLIQNARLRLSVTSGSESGGSVFLVSNHYSNSSLPWDEMVLTSGNAPEITGEPLSTSGQVAAGTWAEFDVTSAIINDGTYSFGITTDSPDLVKYDSRESSHPPELIITVADNTSPVAVDDSVTTVEDEAVSIDVTANDYDEDNEIDKTTVSIVDSVANGTVVVDSVSGVVTYNPEPDFFGTDMFKYSVKDIAGAVSNTARVLVTVQSQNDSPVAVDDHAETLEAVSVEIKVLENDLDVDGLIDSTTLAVVNEPSNGSTEVIRSNGVIAYTPNPHFFGIDSLSYTVADDQGAVSNIAKVMVQVKAVNSPPFAMDDTVTTDENMPVEIAVTANDIDSDGEIDRTSVALSKQPVNGTASVDSSAGIILYTPHPNYFGEDSLTYTVRDNDQAISNEASVKITIRWVNSPPVIVSHTPEELELSPVQGEVINFSIEVTDGDNDTITYEWRRDATPVSISDQYLFDTADAEPGSYLISVIASDGQNSDSLQWQVEMTVTSVELSSFTAHFNEYEGVRITWVTALEINNQGFNILRSESRKGIFSKINEKTVSSNSKGPYKFWDKNVQAGNRYFYMLESVDLQGVKTQHGPVLVDIAAPKTFELTQNFPNPFNPETQIRFTLPKSSKVVFMIYNVLGNEIKTLFNEEKSAGFHVLTWDGTDNFGRSVSSGIYYYRIEAGDFQAIKKMLLLK